MASIGRGAKVKGANAERELLKLLQEALAKHGVTLDLTRNLEQTRNGGADCLGVPGIALEIKRQETIVIPLWWRQTQTQAGDSLEPVLAYRPNREPWAFVTRQEWGCPGFLRKRKVDGQSLIISTVAEFIPHYAQQHHQRNPQ